MSRRADESVDSAGGTDCMSGLARGVAEHEGGQRAATVHVGVCRALAMPQSARSTMASARAEADALSWRLIALRVIAIVTRPHGIIGNRRLNPGSRRP